MAHPWHEEVRRRYGFRCGYCGVSETDTGGELTVDHHQPVAADGDDSDENLVYACFRCNTYKGDYFPTPADIQQFRRILHPLRDSLSIHLRENEQTGLLEPLTDTGRFHVLLLRLNRPQLVEHRIQSRLAQLLAASAQLLQEENQALRRSVTVLEDYLRRLRIQQAAEGAEGPPAS
jgi:hypothetical protein